MQEANEKTQHDDNNTKYMYKARISFLQSSAINGLFVNMRTVCVHNVLHQHDLLFSFFAYLHYFYKSD